MYERDNKFDDILKNELKRAVWNTDPSDECKERIDAVLDSVAFSSERFGGTGMKKRLLTKAAAIVAVCAVAGGGVAYASGGFDTIIAGSHAYYDYENYDQIAEAEQKAGFDAVVPEAFSNGYSFEGITIVDVAEADESGNTTNESKELDVGYVKDGMPDVNLLVSTRPMSPEDKENPSAVQSVKGTTLYYDNTEYLIVPADYEVSDDDLQRAENDPHFTISYGSDEVETNYVGQVFWENDGVTYMIQSLDGTQISGEEMFEMAGEMIN